MGLKDIDIDAALRLLAERRIEEAMGEGKFERLAGMGRPLELEPLPADENARLMWWALRILRQNDVLPDEIRWRKAIDLLKSRLYTADSDQQVTALVDQINTLVRKVNTLGTNAIVSELVELDLAVELDRRRLRMR